MKKSYTNKKFATKIQTLVNLKIVDLLFILKNLFSDTYSRERHILFFGLI